MVCVPTSNITVKDAAPFWSVVPPPIGTPESRKLTDAPAIGWGLLPGDITLAVNVIETPYTAPCAELVKLIVGGSIPHCDLACGARQTRSNGTEMRTF
jgi:hypothetical protein